jgi:hypothetical protein
MNVTTWYAFGIAALALAGVAIVYIVAAWRKAPRAYRAMKWVAAASLAAGVFVGILTDQAARRVAERGVDYSFGAWGSNECSPDGLPAATVGKAIVLTNQQHAGNPLWVDPSTVAPLCDAGIGADHNVPCEIYFLDRHALGLDLTRGDTRKCIPYEEVAEICADGEWPKGEPLCEQAFAFQRRGLKP